MEYGASMITSATYCVTIEENGASQSMHDSGQKKLSTRDTLTLRRRAKAEAVSKTGQFK